MDRVKKFLFERKLISSLEEKEVVIGSYALLISLNIVIIESKNEETIIINSFDKFVEFFNTITNL